MRNRTCLYGSAALIGLTTFGAAAHAEEPVAAQAAAADAQPAVGKGDGDIVVYGRGQTRQVQELQKADIAAAI